MTVNCHQYGRHLTSEVGEIRRDRCTYEKLTSRIGHIILVDLRFLLRSSGLEIERRPLRLSHVPPLLRIVKPLSRSFLWYLRKWITPLSFANSAFSDRNFYFTVTRLQLD